MRRFHTFTVVPALPKRLEPLRELAYNLRWSWDHDSINLFRGLDRDLWESCGHNPVLLLGMLPQERLTEAASDSGFVERMDRVYRELKQHLTQKTWFDKNNKKKLNHCIAYFSAEFGLTECVPIYSGGLGLLAGDHLKSCSETGIPLYGVTLLYQKGYFRQYLNVDGWQQENYPSNDFSNLPIKLEKDDKGNPIIIHVDFPGRKVGARVWRINVGRITLLLLDSNIPENDPRDHNITNALYGGDIETRIQQEIMLGIGGTRALAALGIKPTVCHMNEGHSAFLALERNRMLMQEKGINYELARQITSSGNLFTTHTPVAAGFDVFHPAMMQVYFEEYSKSLGLKWDEFLALGRVNEQDLNSGFNMAVLAAKHAPYVNGVSKLHGAVSRAMMEPLWPGWERSDVPVTSVTNGIHTRSWLSEDMTRVLTRYLGDDWVEDLADHNLWDRIDDIPDDELWSVHERRRFKLVQFARARIRKFLTMRGAPRSEIDAAGGVLHPEVLTIGFARRFATYKRATLLLSDPERLKKILLDPERPVQLVFAGKAHPRDDAGKDFLKQIVHFARQEGIRNHVVVLEDYDISVARILVQGVDVWLNTPRRPMEASGTSGMKIVPNGGLNMSILDGWWAEAYDPEVGWAIGSGEEYSDSLYQDRVEAGELYKIIEKDMVPLFYNRNEDRIPTGWVAMMKASMRKLSPMFNTNRMVQEYATRFYMPAGERYMELSSDDTKPKHIVEWRGRVKQEWHNVGVASVTEDVKESVRAGSKLKVSAWIKLGKLKPEDVQVEIYHGQIHSELGLSDGERILMNWKESKDGQHLFEGSVKCDSTGLQGYTVRVLPYHVDAVMPYDLNLICWE